MAIVEFTTREQLEAHESYYVKDVITKLPFPIYYVGLPIHPVPWDGNDAVTRTSEQARIRKERLNWCIEHIQRGEEQLRVYACSVYGHFFFREFGDALQFYLVFNNKGAL